MTDEFDPLTGELLPKSSKLGQSSPTVSVGAPSETDLQNLEGMSRECLINLIKRVSRAVWGVGAMSPAEREEAILLKLSILALTSTEAKDVVSTAKEYFDRSRGRPMQSIDLNQKIGIVQIVLEASKLMDKEKPLLDITHVINQ